MQDGRDLRSSNEFRFDFISSDETNMLKEVFQLGISNFVETTMSLKSLEIKKNIEVLTREYLLNGTIRRVHDFMLGEILEYFIQGNGELKQMVTRINNGIPKILGSVKTFKVWIRDMVNNFIWSFDIYKM